MFSRGALFVALVFLVGVLVGCADQYSGRMGVSGGVKLEGQPLKAGSITFVPLEKENQDTKGGAEIKDGKYSIPAKSGLKPGQYLIQVTSGDGKTPAAGEMPGQPGGSTNIVSVDLIPDEYNVNSQQKVEVKSKGDNKFDIDIPHMNPKAKKKR